MQYKKVCDLRGEALFFYGLCLLKSIEKSWGKMGQFEKQ